MQTPSYSGLSQAPNGDSGSISFQDMRQEKHINYNHQYDTTYYDSSSLENPCTSGIFKTTPQPPDSTEFPEVDTTDSSGRRRRRAFLKQNHSEIEKRRRDKMNTYITELSSMIPMCSGMSRKLDKITVLRMVVDHFKTIRGPAHSYTETHYKPPIISDQELKQLILQVAEGFIFVVGCDRGKIFYVSDSVSKILHYSKNDLLRQSLFDILHPKDVAKVKEQLSSSDHNPREKPMSSKISRLCPGARRSFCCRMKCNRKEHSERKYNVIHCTGYLKSWPPSTMGLDEHDIEADGDSFNVSCLVAIGRILPRISEETVPTHDSIHTKPIEFVSKYSVDGKFVYVDQRVTIILGFLPQELLGCSMYEYFHPEDISALAESHKMALQTMEKLYTKTYRFKTKEGNFVNIQSEWKVFKNPWTKEIDYLISKNNLILDFERVESTELNKHHIPVEHLEFINEPTKMVPEPPDEGIIKLMEDVTTKPALNKQPSVDGNDEAAMAIIMSLLEVDAGLGGPVDFSGLPWPLP